MKQICCICGEEEDELFMYRIQTSRVHWMCAQCYKRAGREVMLSLGVKRRRIRTERKKEEQNR